MGLEPGQTIAHYRIDRKIGEGGMGEVYAATDTRLHRSAAIKALPAELARDPERLARFQREAQLLASLNHENIASIFGLEESEGQPFLAMELVEGEDLQARLERGPIPVDEAVEIATQIAAALEEAHDRGIVHRDLKPANVKVTPDGKVKVLDFGLAKAFSSDADAGGASASLSMSPTMTAHMGTQAGVIMGTAAYMSPEQARGKAVDRRSDLWAFGVVLFEMLTGERMYGGETVTDIIAAVVTREPDWDKLPAGTGGNVRRLLRRCLQRDPRQRLRDAGDARIELTDAGPEPTAVEPAATLAPRRRGGRILFAVVGILITAAALRAILMPAVERPIVWSTLPAPAGVAYAFPRFLELSPDGRHVAFVAEGPDGKPMLWVRDLASETAQPLAGTGGAQMPFWSPDSSSIAFFAERKLRRVKLDGGVPTAIADVSPNPRGGCWGEGGVILFVPGWSHPVYRVSESGGAPEAVTQLDPERMELSHRWPHLLPDGRHFLYYVVSTYPELNPENPSAVDKSGVYIGSFDGEPPRLLLTARSRVTYVDGRLLYVDSGVLTARRFDLASLSFTDEPVSLATGVTQSVNALWGGALFSVSDEGTLLFVRGAPERDALLQPVWRDREGKELGTLGEPSAYEIVRISHDGKRVAVAIDDPGDLWILDTTRGTSARFTFDTGNDTNPNWSPDDRTIVFSSARVIPGKGFRPTNLFTRPVSGVEAEKLLVSLDNIGFPTDWSPDGQQVALEALNPGTGTDIWIYSIADGTSEPLVETNAEEGSPRFSPDGRWIAYYSTESGESRIYVQAYPGPGGKWQISNGTGRYPVWRSDGKELFYLDDDDVLWAVPVESGEGFQAGAPVRLFGTSRRMNNSAVTPYDASPGAQRFLILEKVETAADIQATVTLVQNWPALLQN